MALRGRRHAWTGSSRIRPGTDEVLTPGGIRHRSRVHHLERGNHVQSVHGRWQIRSADGRILAEEPPPDNLPDSNGSRWITDAYWTCSGDAKITRFSATWVVPDAPSEAAGQLIYLFNGLETKDFQWILQPVLQWGASEAGDAGGWGVANWFVHDRTTFRLGKLYPVAPGKLLVGVMTQTARADGQFDFTCGFQGMSDEDLPTVTWPTELTTAFLTLEAYNTTDCKTYPASPLTTMRDLAIRTTGGNVYPGWQKEDLITGCGETTNVRDNATAQAQVDLVYRGPGV